MYHCVSKLHMSGVMSSNVLLQLHINMFSCFWMYAQIQSDVFTSMGYQQMYSCLPKGVHRSRVILLNVLRSYLSICSRVSKVHRSRVILSSVLLSHLVLWSKVHSSGVMSFNVPLQLHINKFVCMSSKVCTGPEWCSLMFHVNGISKNVFLPLYKCAQIRSDVLQFFTSMESLLMCSCIFKVHRSGEMFHFNWISINLFSCLWR